MSILSHDSPAGQFDYVDIAAADEVKQGERIFVDTGSQTIVVLNINGEFFAIEDVCSHDQGPLGDGEVSDHEIHCPRHGASFDIRSGNVLSLPAIENIQAFPVRVANGMIQLGLPSEE